MSLTMRRRLVRVNPDLVAVEMNRPYADRVCARRQARLASPYVKPPLMKRAFDFLADNGALAKRAGPVAALILADIIAVVEVIDRVSVIVNHDARRELTIEYVGGFTDVEAGHKDAAKLGNAALPVNRTR